MGLHYYQDEYILNMAAMCDGFLITHIGSMNLCMDFLASEVHIETSSVKVNFVLNNFDYTRHVLPLSWLIYFTLC